MTQTQSKPKELDLQIFGLNECNRIAKIEVENVLNQLSEYEGQKLFTGDGNLTKKTPVNFIRTVPQPFTPGDHAANHVTYLNNTGGSLWLKVSICINGGSYDVKPATAYCHYSEREIYIAEMNGQTLVKIADQPTIDSYKLDGFYTVSGVQAMINQYSSLKEQMRNLKNQIPVNFYE